MISSTIERLAKDYISDVDKVYTIMIQGLKLKSKKELIKYREVQGKGEFYLNGNNRYTFHGSGCRFSNNKLKIDWDFGYGDVLCGIDPWKLFYYIKDNRITNEFNDGYQIKELFDELVINGILIKKNNLYYFFQILILYVNVIIKWNVTNTTMPGG